MSQTTEGQKTAAALAGATAREGIGIGEATSGVAAMIGNAVKTITVDAGQAGAGVAAFLAPVMGPAAVGAGAATQGAVLSMAAFDIGAWSIDQDQLAMVHKNEMVMTASQSDGLRNVISAASGGLSGGGTTHNHNYGAMNVNASGRGIEAMIKADPKGAAKGIAHLIRQGHLSGLRA